MPSVFLGSGERIRFRGPQLVWIRPCVCHVPQEELGTGTNWDRRGVSLSGSEYASIAKSPVRSTPDTRTGLTSSPQPELRANVTQDSKCRLMYLANEVSDVVSSLNVGCFVTSAAPRFPVSSNEKLVSGSEEVTPTPGLISRTVSVQRQPDGSWLRTNSPTLNASNVAGTSTPSRRDRKEEQAENGR